MPVYVEQHYCSEHVTTHWQEVKDILCGADTRVICHGADYGPYETAKTFVKARGRGFLIYKRKKLFTNLPIIVPPSAEPRRELVVDF